MSKKIVMLDPGVNEKGQEHADNLGDIVISRAIYSSLKEMFPDANIIRIPSHQKLTKKHYEIIDDSDYTFLAGTNLLSSSFRSFNRPLGPLKLSDVIRRRLKKTILFGVGWGYGYGEKVSLITKFIYRYHLINKTAVHAVRDSYSEGKARNEIGIKVNNTNCPTMWKLNGLPMDLTKEQQKIKTCVFTLTDYLKDYDKDNDLIDLLLRNFDHIYFFPQGKWDEQYIKLLPSYVNNSKKIHLIEHSIQAYDNFIKSNEFVYIGTRLHGGIRCLQEGVPAYIISIDNRAECIAKDTNLASGSRTNLELVENWLSGKSNYGNLNLNLVGIDSFLNAYK